MGRALYLLVALLTAILAALLLVVFARYNIGMSREAIRADALSVAGFLFAAIVVVGFFKRR
jgi:hypothetical protein